MRAKRFLRALYFPITCLLALSPNSIAGQFKVSRVYDGDTIKIEVHKTGVRCRLVGTDAPETGETQTGTAQPYGEDAKGFLETLILNRHVEIKSYGLESMDLQLVEVFLENRSVNLEMIKAGFAEVYRGGLPEGFNPAPFFEAERRAKEARKGMWAQGDD